MIRYRNMTRAELGTVLSWAGAEGWNPGIDDADAFWAADPDGFFVAEEDGAPVAAISVVVHSDRFAFLGLYICLPSHRGRGIGLALWRHALEHAGGRTVGLDGVPDQQANYEASGFIRAGETVRYVGRPSGGEAARLREAEAGEIPELVEMEAAASGWSKPAYLTAWLSGAPTRQALVLDGPDGIEGAAVLRRCRSGAKIGPVMARGETAALRILRAAAAGVDGDLTIDVPQQAAGFGRLLEAEGLSPGFETARMYRGDWDRPAPGGPTLYGVTTLELG